MLAQPLGVIERAWPADIVFEEILKLGLERGIGLRIIVGLFEFEDERHQRLGDEAAAIDAEETSFIGSGTVGIGADDIHERVLAG